MSVARILMLLFVCSGLQGCTLFCASNKCHSVEYYQRQAFFPTKVNCGTFPCPCPAVKVPGYYATDLSCVERLQKLSTLRARGVGVIVLGDRLRFIIPSDSFFTRDTLDINACHVSTLADIAEILKMLPCAPLYITGHTDNVGTRRCNFKRSKAMAQIVAGHLWAQGVEWDRMQVIGKADCEPIACDRSVFGSTDNRRVEIRLDFSRNYYYNCLYNNAYCPDCVESSN